MGNNFSVLGIKLRPLSMPDNVLLLNGTQIFSGFVVVERTLCVSKFMCVCHVSAVEHRDWRRASDLLDLNYRCLWAASCGYWHLDSGPERAASVPNVWTISPVFQPFLSSWSQGFLLWLNLACNWTPSSPSLLRLRRLPACAATYGG